MEKEKEPCPKCGLHHDLEQSDMSDSDIAENNRRLAEEAIEDRDVKLCLFGQMSDLADVQRVLFLLVDHFRGDIRNSRKLDESDKKFIADFFDELRREGW